VLTVAGGTVVSTRQAEDDTVYVDGPDNKVRLCGNQVIREIALNVFAAYANIPPAQPVVSLLRHSPRVEKVG
jgi:hypothetical protein